MGPEDTHTRKDDQICAVLKSGIGGSVNGVQSIWNANFTKENWVFLHVDTDNAFNEINRIGMLWTVRNLWPSGDHFF